MSSTSSNTEEFTYNELMEQYVKATRLIEHLKSQRDRSKRAFDKAMDLVLKYDARIAELEAVIDMATNQSNNLRPCPFCGGEAITTAFFDADDFDYMPIEVNDCDAEVTCENERCINGWYLSPKAWNTRPIEDALNARIAELEAENAGLKERVAMLDVTAVFKSLGEMGYIEQTNRLHTRIAELDGFIDRLIELGEWGMTGMEIVTSFRGGEMHNLAIKQGDKWDALVKDWKERER